MKEIKARTGHYLTQSAEVGENRIFVTAIKGVNVNEEDWREATDEEVANYLQQREKIINISRYI